MKKITLSSLLLFMFCISFAQDIKDSDRMIPFDSINKWTIELSVGNGKGLAPFTKNLDQIGRSYYQSNPRQWFGTAQINSFNLGIRHMFSPIAGIRTNLAYEIITDAPGSGSASFQMNVLSLGVEGVVNVSRLFKMDEYLGRFGFNVHGGVIFSSNTSKTKDVFTLGDHNFGVTEYNGGITIGATPQFRLSKRFALFADVTGVINFRQHFNWDGSYATDNQNNNISSGNVQQENNLFGQMIRTSLGLSYSFGRKHNEEKKNYVTRYENDNQNYKSIHGDFAKILDKDNERIATLDKRVNEMETLMNDTDKDGVPDYLDVENNSIAGSVVDTKGRMIDLNKNGIPDALEKKLDSTYAKIDSNNTNTSKNTIVNMINDGYVTAYFDTNKSIPTNVSSEGIDFILSYLRNNPSDTVDIIGHADEISSTEYNNKLSLSRAEAVKGILTKAGVDPSRLNVVSKGEDNSVDVNSDGARKLVRKVSFKVNQK